MMFETKTFGPFLAWKLKRGGGGGGAMVPLAPPPSGYALAFNYF